MAGGGTERQGSRGCLLGGPAWRAQVSRWGGGRGANCHLSEHTLSRLGQLPGPGRPRQLRLCVLGPAPWGLPRQLSSACVRAASSPGLQGRTLSLEPRRASPLPGTPCLPARYRPGVSASAPPGPLVTPWVPPDPQPSTHTLPAK